MNLDKFFKKGELIPVICQDERNNEVLMLGYANKQALANRNRLVFLPQPSEAVEQGRDLRQFHFCQ